MQSALHSEDPHNQLAIAYHLIVDNKRFVDINTMYKYDYLTYLFFLCGWQLIVKTIRNWKDKMFFFILWSLYIEPENSGWFMMVGIVKTVYGRVMVAVVSKLKIHLTNILTFMSELLLFLVKNQEWIVGCFFLSCKIF